MNLHRKTQFARLTIIAALVFMALRPAHADAGKALTERLVQFLSDGATLVCGPLKITSADGKLHMDGPNGAFKIEVKNDDLYIGGNRCIPMKCPKEAKKEERQC
jgi:hypothetical protein